MTKAIPAEYRKRFICLLSRLSPENLSCDGELDATATAARRAQVTKEWQKLENELGFPVLPEDIEDNRENPVELKGHDALIEAAKEIRRLRDIWHERTKIAQDLAAEATRTGKNLSHMLNDLPPVVDFGGEIEALCDALDDLEGCNRATSSSHVDRVMDNTAAGNSDSPPSSAVIAFVQGAKWWEWHSRKATMWSSDQRLAEAEAERRQRNGTLGVLSQFEVTSWEK